MDIPEELQKTHSEFNEDGKEYKHPGYGMRYCKKCGKSYIAGRGACFSDEGGYPDCGNIPA